MEASVNPTSKQIPTSGNETLTVTSTPYDKYDIRLATSKAGSPTVTPSYTTGTTVGTPNTSGTSDTTTITVNNNAKMNGDTNSKSVSLDVKYGSITKTISYTLTDPQYNYAFDGNGGTMLYNGSFVSSINLNNTYYGTKPQTAGVSSFTGARAGFKYMGMYADDKADS